MTAARPVLNLRRHLFSRRARYNETFNNPTGIATLRSLRKFCKMDQDVYVTGDSETTAYHLGMQRVYRHIESVMNMNTETLEQISGSDE